MKRLVVLVALLGMAACVWDGSEIEIDPDDPEMGLDETATDRIAGSSAGDVDGSDQDVELIGPLVVYSNASRVFRWRAHCNCVETIEGRFLDLTRAAGQQDGVPRRTSIDFLKIDSSIGNITAGGFWFRSANVAGEGVWFAAR